MKNKFGKLISAVVTPFNDNDEIDFDVFASLISKIEEGGHESLVICGSTGEGESLTLAEKIALLKFCHEKTKLNIIYTISAGCSNKVISEISAILKYEPGGILLTVPPYYKAPMEGIVQHFAKVCQLFPLLPFIIYNIPSRTGSSLDFLTISKIKSNSANVVALKDCSNDFAMIKKCSVTIADLDIYSGNDNMLLEYLEAGARGAISVASVIFAHEFLKIIDDYYLGFNNLILDKFLKYTTGKLSMMVNPIGIKALLELSGYEAMNLRLPLIKLPSCFRANLKNLI